MKRYILVWCNLCLLIGFLSSCNEDEKNGFPTGILYLNVEEDATMLTKAENKVTYESLQVVILQGEEDAQDTMKVYNDYLKEVKDQRLILPVGKYTVTVRSNGADGVGWEKPLYVGKEELEVKQGEITNTKVVCKIANTKVSVVYDGLQKYFADYRTTVSTSSDSLVYTRDEYRAGFFVPEKLSVKLNLINNDGNTFVLKKVYPDIQPQYHYVFKYTVSSKPGEGDEAGADFDVIVDKEHDEITYKIFIKEESLVGAGEPSFALGGAFLNGNVYSFKKTEENQKPSSNTIWLDYVIGSKNDIQSFTVEVNSPSFQKQTLNIQEGEGTLIGFPALPGEEIPGDDRIKKYRLDLSSIVDKLGSVNDEATDHKFTVNLLDNRHQETTIDFTIQIIPDLPAIVNEPYCWSTFAVLQGNCADESSYFVLKTPSGEEILNNQDFIKRDKKDNMSVLVTGLKPGEYSYKIRSAVDDELQSNSKSFTVYDPTKGDYNVPNLGFDVWNEITENRPDFKALGLVSSKKYWAPNATNDYNKTYWESGNFGASAGGKTLTSSTDEKVVSVEGNKNAAKLSSIYVGVGSLGAFSAGSVFAGSLIDVGENGAKLLYGRPHIGLPTHLSGYYKYKPGSIDYVLNEKKGNGKTDQAIIYIALSTKQFKLESLRTNVSGVVRFDKNDDSIFAYGELIEANNVDDYKKFDILLKYRKEKIPNYEACIKDGVPQIYITIVATSSIDGDKFTGSESSVLYVDEFSLDYDYDPASFADTEFKDLNPININDK